MSHDDRDRTDHDQFDRDDSLRALLRAADPVSSMSPVDPRSLPGLLDEVVATGGSVQPDGGRRRAGTWLVAAAAAAIVVTAGVGAVHSAMSPDPSTLSQAGASPSSTPSTAPPAGPTPTAPSGSSSVSLGTPTPAARTVLSVSAAAFTARCAVPNATTLQLADTAFAGTVTSIRGKRVTLQRSDTFRGDVADAVVVRAPITDISRLVQTVKFKVGGSYLVSATGGEVSLCGFTGPAQPALQGIYAEAFPQ